MISYTTGDILSSPAQVITNAVNCVGVMGKGLALQFKSKYPSMFQDYSVRCKNNKVLPGRPYLYEDDQVQILNFPTKRDWRETSLLSDIEEGLIYLSQNFREMGIYSLALPALGCGLGGLKWNEVKPLIEKYLSALPDLEVFIYLSEELIAGPNSFENKDEGHNKTNSGFAAVEI